jgi:6-phosphogluconolactonase (cycloisomerase 2 family)
VAVLAAVVAAAVAVPAGARGKPNVKPRVVGAVYTETNDPAANRVVVFARYSDGHLKQRQVVRTGGQGGQQQQPGCTAHCPILDTQGEVVLASGGRWLLAVNAGNNTISVFQVTSRGLKLAQQKSSGGVFPNSIAIHGGLVYVLNSNSRNIVGFRLSSRGKLTRINGSTRSLTSNADSGNPRQVGFDQQGRVLVVALLTSSGTMSPARTLNTFVVRPNGTPGPAKAYNATTAGPFAFAFDPRRNHLVVTQVANFTASYRVTSKGVVTQIDTKSSHGNAPCWIAITGNGRYAYVVNTGAIPGMPPSVARYALGLRGKLTFLGITPNPLGERFKTDDALSPDSKYLYVLAPGLTAATSHIDVYKLGKNGSLKLVSHTPSTLAAGLSGIAAS